MRLEDQRQSLHAGITDLTQSVDALIGVDADDGVVVVRRNRAGTHIGDSQFTRFGVRVHAMGSSDLSSCITPQQVGRRPERDGTGRPAQHVSSADLSVVAGIHPRPSFPLTSEECVCRSKRIQRPCRENPWIPRTWTPRETNGRVQTEKIRITRLGWVATAESFRSFASQDLPLAVQNVVESPLLGRGDAAGCRSRAGVP